MFIGTAHGAQTAGGKVERELPVFHCFILRARVARDRAARSSACGLHDNAHPHPPPVDILLLPLDPHPPLCTQKQKNSLVGVFIKFIYQVNPKIDDSKSCLAPS
jgi:hypothetical protein